MDVESERMFSWFGKRQAQNPAASAASVADRDDQSATATATALSDALPEAETRPGAPAVGAAALAAAAAGVTGATQDVAPAADPTHGLNVDAFLAPPPAAENANAQPAVGPADAEQTDALKPTIVEAISTVFD